MLRSAIDSLFAGRRERAQRQPPKATPTLAEMYLAAMRTHERRAAILHWAEERWSETPDWRLDRQVIRLALFLRERFGLKPVDRVAILSGVCREWALAELASLVQGAVPVALDPVLPEGVLANMLSRLAPRAVFVNDEATLVRFERIRGELPGPIGIIVFEAAETVGQSVLSEALDLGGTLDTPERAQAFRARAREVKPEAEALAFPEDAEGSAPFTFLTHQDAVGRLVRLWSNDVPQQGDLTYLASGPASQGALLALLAAIGDGLSGVAFGTAGREAAEIAALSPQRIVASSRLLRTQVAQASGSKAARQALGGRARWVHPVIEQPEDAAALAPLNDVVTMDLQI